MEKNYVTFYFPRPSGLSEDTTTMETASWDIDEAVKAAAHLKGVSGKRPYGFRFHANSDGTVDLKNASNKSSKYHIGGVVRTLDEISRNKSADNYFLIEEMKRRGFTRMLIDTKSGEFISALKENDIVLEKAAKA